MCESLMVLSLLFGFVAVIQQPTPDRSASQMSAYASQREALMAPGNDVMQRSNYAEALEEYRRVLTQYPNDARVLMVTGYAAWAAGNLDDAANYLRGCEEIPSRYPWGVRLSLLQVNAALGHWREFSEEQAAIEKAAIRGDPQLRGAMKDGFLLERFNIGSQYIEAIDYPQPNHPGGVRYRFRFGGKPDSDAVFVPQVDLVERPDQFVLEQYSEPQKQELVRSYPGHEPPYEDVRAVVLRFLEMQLGTTEIIHLSPYSKLN